MSNNSFLKANLNILCCPVCSSGLQPYEDNNALICSNNTCGTEFPIYNDIPCILNEQNSVFSNQDFANQDETFFRERKNKFRNIVKKDIPDINVNVSAKANYRGFAEGLDNITGAYTKKKVLVLGGSIAGEGMMELLNNYPLIEFVETDVSFGPRAMLLCDAHNLPFINDSFDGVIAQAVL